MEVPVTPYFALAALMLAQISSKFLSLSKTWISIESFLDLLASINKTDPNLHVSRLPESI
jgi:hypothetical protein